MFLFIYLNIIIIKCLHRSKEKLLIQNLKTDIIHQVNQFLHIDSEPQSLYLVKNTDCLSISWTWISLHKFSANENV